MPVFTSSIEVTANYPTIKPSLNLNFARSRALDPRITFTRASTATYVGRDGLIKYAGVDEPRFDHDPATGKSLGLLIEEPRTNLITNSALPLSAVGGNLTSSNLTVSVASSTVSPDGTTDGVFRYTSGPSSAAYRFGSAGGGVAQATYTGSIWVRAVSGTASFNIDINDQSAVAYTVDENWRRVTASGARSDAFAYMFMDVNASPNNDLYFWGPQLEQATFETSYIKTTGSTVTRADDKAEVFYDGWYDNGSSVKPSTFVGKFQVYDLSATRMVAEGSNGSTLKDFSMNTMSNSTNFQFVHRYSASDSYGSATAGITVNTPVTFAFSYDGTGGDITGSANSSTPIVGTDDLGTTSQAGGDRMRIGSRGNNSLYLNGTISELRYYKFKASSAQLLLLQ